MGSIETPEALYHAVGEIHGQMLGFKERLDGIQNELITSRGVDQQLCIQQRLTATEIKSLKKSVELVQRSTGSYEADKHKLRGAVILTSILTALTGFFSYFGVEDASSWFR